MRVRTIAFACSVSAAFALAACGSSQPTSPSASATGPRTSSGPTTSSGHYQAKLVLDGQPELTADGKNIVVNVNVTNDGPGTFGSTTEPNNVNLGAHAIDAAGKDVANDLARGHLPQVAPGATARTSIQLPVSQTLGHRAEILPVEEGIAWFDQWGTQPLVVGPFKPCTNAAMGAVCDAAGKPLPIASAGR